MKRRNFLRGILGAGAVVVAAPVIAKVMPVEDWIDRIHRLGGELDDLNAKPNMMKVSGAPLSTGNFAKEISGGFEKHYEKMKPVYLNEIFTKK